MDVAAYLDRVGLDAADVATPDPETLHALQRAHVTTIPWETLGVAGDPFGPAEGEGISLDREHLFEKLVVRERGGFCYEQNALFEWALTELGFDVSVRAAHMLDDAGEVGAPAVHSALVVGVEGERLLTDVGLGVPPMRRPTPLPGGDVAAGADDPPADWTGDAVEDEAGVEWRVVASDRPDADIETQFRKPGEREWSDRYVLRDVDREWAYFDATCEYLATAPESPFTGSPSVSLATPKGYVKLRPDTVVERAGHRRVERPIREPEWRDRLRTTFGLDPGFGGEG